MTSSIRATRVRAAASLAGVLLAMGLPVAGRAAGGPPPFAAEDVLAGPVPARVIAVIDGDTLVVRARIWLGQVLETRVRLAGIDAPELRGRCAEERERAARARDFLARAVDGGEIVLRGIEFGKYAGRVIARVETAAGEDLAAALLRAGLAREYGGARRRSWCREGEEPPG